MAPAAVVVMAVMVAAGEARALPGVSVFIQQQYHAPPYAPPASPLLSSPLRPHSSLATSSFTQQLGPDVSDDSWFPSWFGNPEDHSRKSGGESGRTVKKYGGSKTPRIYVKKLEPVKKFRDDEKTAEGAKEEKSSKTKGSGRPPASPLSLLPPVTRAKFTSPTKSTSAERRAAYGGGGSVPPQAYHIVQNIIFFDTLDHKTVFNTLIGYRAANGLPLYKLESLRPFFPYSNYKG